MNSAVKCEFWLSKRQSSKGLQAPTLLCVQIIHAEKTDALLWGGRCIGLQLELHTWKQTHWPLTPNPYFIGQPVGTLHKEQNLQRSGDPDKEKQAWTKTPHDGVSRELPVTQKSNLV